MRTYLKWGALAVGLGLVPTLVMDVPAGAHKAPKDVVFVQHGQASWYRPGFHGKKTASGERFNQHALTAAHRQLPLGTEATVTNLENGKKVEVEITDRGPYVRGRVIDVSRAVANKLDMRADGTVKVRIEVTAEQLAEREADHAN